MKVLKRSCEMNSNDGALDAALQNQVAKDEMSRGCPDDLAASLHPSGFLHCCFLGPTHKKECEAKMRKEEEFSPLSCLTPEDIPGPALESELCWGFARTPLLCALSFLFI